MTQTNVDAIVVGAGPYGLAIASNLASRGVECRVFGSPMAGWKEHMPKGMFLKSTARDSDIGAAVEGFGILDYCRTRGITPYNAGGGERPIPIDEFIGYGLWLQEHLVPGIEDARILSVRSAAEGFVVEVDSGEQILTGNVVLAVGTAPFAYVPPELRGEVGGRPLPFGRDGLISHSAHHADLSALRNQRVAVIGAGQSALESAVLLNEAGATVHLVARRPAIKWIPAPVPEERGFVDRLMKPPAPLGAGWDHVLITRYAAAYRHLPGRTRLSLLRKLLDPAVAWWLRDRVSDDVEMRLGRSLRGAVGQGDGVVLELEAPGGQVEKLPVDHIIAATGYRVGLEPLDMLSPPILKSIATLGGYPRLSATFESSVKGLYFAGLVGAGTFGPMLRFVYGSRFAAQKVSLGIAGKLKGHPASSRAKVSLSEGSGP